MSNKVGKATENRVRWGRWIVSSINTHKDHFCEKLDGRMNLSVVDWNKWFCGQRDELSTSTEAVFEAALALATERADDPAHRDERDELVEAMMSHLASTRSILESVDARHVRRYGLDGRMPRSAESLESFARNVIRNLRESQATFTTLGIDVSTSDLADKLETHDKALREKIVELKGEERKAEALLIKRDALLDDWTRIYQAVARMIEGAYRLAGEDQLADRIRPTVAKAIGKEGPDQDEDNSDEPSVFDEDDNLEDNEPVGDGELEPMKD